MPILVEASVKFSAKTYTCWPVVVVGLSYAVAKEPLATILTISSWLLSW